MSQLQTWFGATALSTSGQFILAFTGSFLQLLGWFQYTIKTWFRSNINTSVCQSWYDHIWRQGCKLWRVAQLQYSQSFRFWQLISGRAVYSIGSSVRGDDVAISPALKCPNRNTDTPTSLTFPGAVGDGLTDKRNNFMPLQERGQSSSLLSQRALNFSLNISRAAASARALSLRLSSFSSSRNLFFASRNALSVRIFSVNFFHAPEWR